VTHRQHFAGLLVQRDDRGLVENDAAAARVDEGVCRPEIDGEVARQD